MSEKRGRSVTQRAGRLPRGLRVTDGPLNNVKLELGLGLLILLVIWILAETWVDSAYAQIVTLVICATILAIWLVARTRHVVREIERERDQDCSEVENGQE